MPYDSAILPAATSISARQRRRLARPVQRRPLSTWPWQSSWWTASSTPSVSTLASASFGAVWNSLSHDRSRGVVSLASLRSGFERAKLPVGAALALVLLFVGLVSGVQPAPRGGPPGDDSILYRKVITDVRAGQGYYTAAMREQRAADYPVRPFVTVRTPVLAEALARLPGPPAPQAAAGLLALIVVAAWAVRLRGEAKRPLGAVLSLLFLLGSAAAAVYPHAYMQHELWSGLLLSLALAVYGPRSWPASLALMLAAAAVRELAAPVLGLMAVMALAEGRRKEALAWAGAIAVYAAGLAWHAAEVMKLTSAAGAASSGWLALGGWPFVLLQMKWNALLLGLPAPVVALAAALVVLGLAGLRGRMETRVAAVLVAYGLAFLVLGRVDNAYWGLMITPLWPVALVGLGRVFERVKQRSPGAEHRPGS